MNEKISSLLQAILSKEGLVGMLLAMMIGSQIYDNYRSTTMQIELNQAIKERMDVSIVEERQHIDSIKESNQIGNDIIKAIEGLKIQ